MQACNSPRFGEENRELGLIQQRKAESLIQHRKARSLHNGSNRHECLCTYSLYELPGCEGDPWHALTGIDSISAASPTQVLRSIKMSLPTCKFQVCKHSMPISSCDNHTGDLCSNFNSVQLNPTGVYGSVTTYECGVAPDPVPTVSPTPIPTLMPTSEHTSEPTPAPTPTTIAVQTFDRINLYCTQTRGTTDWCRVSELKLYQESGCKNKITGIKHVDENPYCSYGGSAKGPEHLFDGDKKTATTKKGEPPACGWDIHFDTEFPVASMKWRTGDGLSKKKDMANFELYGFHGHRRRSAPEPTHTLTAATDYNIPDAKYHWSDCIELATITTRRRRR